MFSSAKRILIFLKAAGLSEEHPFNELAAQQLRVLESIIISQNPNPTLTKKLCHSKFPQVHDLNSQTRISGKYEKLCFEILTGKT